MTSYTGPAARLLDPAAGIDAIVGRLSGDGYRVIAPVERDGAVAYDEVGSGDELPVGLVAEQSPGRWRAMHDGSARRFSWTPAGDSWKRFFSPPDHTIVTIRRRDGSFEVDTPAPPSRPLALIGVRDCELRALAVLDRVLADPVHPDPRYVARRADTFVVAVTCTEPAATCWCTSMGGGPNPTEGFDLTLTELHDDDGHRLMAIAGSDRGAALLDRLAGAPAGKSDIAASEAAVAAATERIRTRLDGATLPAMLHGTELHPHWDDVASRCLSCGNCTLVCPTCFCTRIEDRSGLPGSDGSDMVERQQRWASCFELDHSNLVGRPVRSTTLARYRQWLTHKLQTWPVQFGTVGCVGCGRCTTWCPAGIDLADEARALVGTPEGAMT